MMDMKKIGKRLRKLRGDIPRKEVAKKCKISVSILSMYENGNRVPRDDVKIKLASFYGTSVEEIFFAGMVTKRKQEGVAT